MDWSSVIFVILLLLNIFPYETAGLLIVNYVIPSTESRQILCNPHVSNHCLTLKEYASEPDLHFANSSVFYFYPARHRLDINLRLTNVHGQSFQGLPGKDVVNMMFDSAASITWERSSNIEISSISFTLVSNITFIIKFEQTLSAWLSNITIFGNGYSGCSSVLCQESTLIISNSNFFEIKGLLGAVLMILVSNITFNGNNSFLNNMASSAGGGIYLSDSTLTLSGESTFLNNTSSSLMLNIIHKCPVIEMKSTYHGSGGAIFARTSSIAISGYSAFIANTAKSSGGAIALYNGTINIQGTTSFDKNSAVKHGGAMILRGTNSTFFERLLLGSNRCTKLGGAIMVIMGSFNFQGYLSFENNSASNGGAIAFFNADFTFCGDIYFGLNTALVNGGALLMSMANGSFDESCHYNGSNSFHNSVRFHHNLVDSRGGAIYSRAYSNLIFVVTVQFTNNIAISFGGAINSQESNVTFKGNATTFYRNKAVKKGGAINGIDSNLKFKGTVQFEKNIAYIGGAMALEGTSKLTLTPTLNMFFIMNHANDSGGALHFEDSQCSTEPIECFIIIDKPICSTTLHFIKNSAESTGSILFGGQLDKCRLLFRTGSETQGMHVSGSHDYYGNDALGTIVNLSTIVQQYPMIAAFASQAKKLDVCQHYNSLRLHPGQQFNMTLIAFGQDGSPVPAKVLTEHFYTGDKYRLSPLSQYISGSCTIATFRLYSADDHSNIITVKLYPENPCQSLIQGYIFYISILPCPLGFELSNDRCVCNKVVQNFIQNCYIDDGLFERKRNKFWISQINGTELIIHKSRCPLDYCKDDPINVTLSDSHLQCDFNRKGNFCGQCQINFSLALGSLHCIPCSNFYVALILIFALAGIALVSIILFFRLTVALGTLNGLIFYANIIQANYQAFFPRATINIFTIFISWLNLDFGVETCFYDGMEIYAYSWFQFLFPFYV